MFYFDISIALNVLKENIAEIEKYQVFWDSTISGFVKMSVFHDRFHRVMSS
jgi:hypothetical protein